MTWRVCASSAGQRRMRPLHRVPSDLPTRPRHLTGSPVGHGRTPAIFPGGPGTNTAGEQHACALTRQYRCSGELCSAVSFQVQMIRGGIVLPSKASLSFPARRVRLHRQPAIFPVSQKTQALESHRLLFLFCLLRMVGMRRRKRFS